MDDKLEKMKDVENHLSFLGYECNKVEDDDPESFDVYIFIGNYLFYMVDYEDVLIILFQIDKPQIEISKNDQNLFIYLSTCNFLNQELIISKSYYDDESEQFKLRASYLFEYDKVKFSRFFTILESDISKFQNRINEIEDPKNYNENEEETDYFQKSDDEDNKFW
jgi:hypothetical protein